MAASKFKRKSVVVALSASILFLAAMFVLAATIPTPTVVAAPSPPYTYNPSSTSLSVPAGDSTSFDLTVGLSFEPEPGWSVETVVEAVTQGPFTFDFNPSSFILDQGNTSEVVHVTVTALEGAADGSYVIKAKQVTTSGPPGVGRGAGCQVTITVLGAPTPTPSPTPTVTSTPIPTATPPPTTTPIATPPPGEEDDGACFIATAAYGTPMAEEIQVLRQFRDEYLVTNPAGQLLVSPYYNSSPSVAEFINDYPALKPVVRAGLLPAVALSSVTVNTTLAQKMAIVGGLLLLSLALAVGLTKRARGVNM